MITNAGKVNPFVPIEKRSPCENCIHFDICELKPCSMGCDLSQGDDFYAFTSIQRTSRKNFQSRNERL